MKIKLLIIGLFFAIGGFAQSTIKFDMVSYNFGKIKNDLDLWEQVRVKSLYCNDF